MRAKVNLIPLNAAPGIPFERPSDQAVDALRAHPVGEGRHRLGPQEPRPRHPRRLRSAHRRGRAQGERGAGPGGGARMARGRRRRPWRRAGSLVCTVLALAAPASRRACGRCSSRSTRWRSRPRRRRPSSATSTLAVAPRSSSRTPASPSSSRTSTARRRASSATSTTGRTTPQGYDATAGTPTRIAGTSWSYLEGSAFTNARLEYVLLFEKETRPDPKNPRTSARSSDRVPRTRMPFWTPSERWRDTADVAEGQVIQEAFDSAALKGTRRVWTYRRRLRGVPGHLLPALLPRRAATTPTRCRCRRTRPADRHQTIPPIIAVFVGLVTPGGEPAIRRGAPS